MSNIDTEEITDMSVDRLMKDTDNGETVPAEWIFSVTTFDDHFVGEIREIRRSGDGEIEITVSDTVGVDDERGDQEAETP